MPISGVSLAGYVALRFVGERYGVALLGVFGGLASSTATTLVYARHSKGNEGFSRLAAVVILLANLMVLVRLSNRPCKTFTTRMNARFLE